VLLVAGRTGAGSALRNLLRLRGFDVRVAETAREARDAILHERPQAAIVDLDLPRGAGLDTVAALPLPAPVLMLTPSKDRWRQLERLRPRSRVVEKPCSLVLVIESLADMLASVESARQRASAWISEPVGAAELHSPA
jgi:DNA-binding response OmpR family regulator